MCVCVCHSVSSNFGDIAVMPKYPDLPGIFELKSINPWNIIMPTSNFYDFENAIRDAEAKLNTIFGGESSMPDQPVSEDTKRKILVLQVWVFPNSKRKIDQIQANALTQLKQQLTSHQFSRVNRTHWQTSRAPVNMLAGSSFASLLHLPHSYGGPRDMV